MVLNPAQKLRISKRFDFEMAHALLGYDGACKNIHGHSYALTITLLGNPRVDIKDPKLGMVMDFGDLKKVVQLTILDQFDHALVLNDASPYAIGLANQAEFEKVVLVPFQPTCENLLLYFVELLSGKFEQGILLYALHLAETKSAGATWCIHDNLNDYITITASNNENNY